MDNETLPQLSDKPTTELEQLGEDDHMIPQPEQAREIPSPTEPVQIGSLLPAPPCPVVTQPAIDSLLQQVPTLLTGTRIPYTIANSLLAISTSTTFPLADFNIPPAVGDIPLPINLTSSLPQLPYFPPLSMNSLLLGAGADIISSIASTLPKSQMEGFASKDAPSLTTVSPVSEGSSTLSNILNSASPALNNTCMTSVQAVTTSSPPLTVPTSVITAQSVSSLVAPIKTTPTDPPTSVSIAFPNIEQLTNEVLLAVQQVSGVQARVIRTSPPSLHANEQLLSEDSEAEAMDTVESEDAVPLDITIHPAVQVCPTVTNVVAPSRCDSVSPYADDDSFASFLAREVHETASALDDDEEEEFISRSPTPSSSQTSSTDMQTLVSYLQSQQQGYGSGGSAILKRFGVTASCPPAPVQLPEGSISAQLDMTSRNFPKRSKYAHRAAMSAMHPYNRTRGGGASVAKTLDLLKAVLQSSFNMEVKRLCDDYLNIFSLAAGNIQENTGDSVPDATLKLLVCKMMEEAQHGYVHGKWEFPCGKLPKNEKVTPASGSPMSTKKLKIDRVENRFGPPKRIRKPPADRHSEKAAIWKWGMDKRRLDPEKWEPESMTATTVFCLGVNVNKALGHSANRGKVYYLHPELFKYACDGDDKTWLYENKYLPVHGGKAFLMIYQEVVSLVGTDDLYKDNPDVVNSVEKLKQFRVPQFMIDKMKTFMKSVQGYFAQDTGHGSATNGSSSTVSSKS